MSVLIFALILGILIIIHEFGHFIVAKISKVKVEAFAIGFGPPIFKRRIKDFDFLICCIPLGGYVKLAGFTQQEYKGNSFEYLSKPPGIRAFIASAGPLFNYLLAWFLFCSVFFMGFSLPSNRVGKLVEGYPAQTSGIKEGDIILEIEGKPVKTWQDITNIIHKSHLKKINIVALRNNKKIIFNIKPKREEVKDIFGKKRVFSFVGIYPSEELVKLRYPFLEAIKQGSSSLAKLTLVTIKSLGYIIIGAIPLRKTLTGPLGIYYITKQASQVGFSALIHLMAVLSMSLTIFNLLPLPVLDGGHIFFLAIEKIRKKSLSLKTEEIINQVGISIIVILVIFVFYNDIVRFGPKIFGK